MSPEMDGAAEKESILVIDPDTSGHHLNYLELVASSFAAAGRGVTVCTDLEAPAVGQYLGGKGWRLVDFKVPSMRSSFRADLGLVLDQLKYWKECQELLRRLRRDGWRGKVFFPYLDRLIHAIGMLGSPAAGSPVAGILMRPQFQARQGGSASLKGQLRKRALTAIFQRCMRREFVSRLFVIDPLTEADVRAALPDQSHRVALLVDPASCFRERPRSEARARLGLPEEAFLILAYGEIAPRKGIAALLQALALRPGFGTAVVVGRGDGDMEQALLDAVGGDPAQLDKIMLRVNRRISEDEEQLYFEAADAVWVAYHDHPGMSGVLVRAGQMAIPVIGCTDGAIGAYCSNQKVGLCVDPANISSVTSVFDEIEDDRRSFEQMGSNGFDVFKDFTPANFRVRLAELALKA